MTNAHSRVRFRLASDEGIATSIRRGDARAFEALYDRHAAELLSFCAYMLTSRADAEDALQATFAAAYRALRGEERPITLRPWLFAIARNQCLTILRRRRPTVELDGERALHGDPARELELREEVRDTLVRLCELPERQRAAMVLSELRGFSQAEIGTVLGVRAEQVKALVYQARADLVSERRAREADCGEIREEIASARGAALLRGRLRRHMRSCEGCRTFAAGVANQRRQLNSWLPFAPSVLLKLRTLQEALGGGLSEQTAYAGGATLSASVAAAGLGLAGGGVKAIALKVMAGAAMLGLSTSVGASVTPSHSITRLTGSLTHVSSAAKAHAGQSGAGGAGAGSSTGLAGHGGGSGGSGGGALGAAGFGASGGAAEARGVSERGASDAKGSSGNGNGAGGGKSAGNGAGAGGHRGSGRGASSAPGNSQQRTREQRAQAREAREQQHGERQQQREARQGSHEHQGQSGEGGSGAVSERQQAAEERQRGAEQRRREAELRQREQEKSKRLGERERGAVQRLREREKGKRGRERERSGVQHVRQHERQQRQHESERQRREREREHRSPRRRRPEEAPAAPGE